MAVVLMYSFAVIFQVKPTIVLLPSRIEDSIEEALKSVAETNLRIDIRPSNEFAPRAAISKILALQAERPTSVQFVTPTSEHLATSSSSDAALLELSTKINLDKEISIGCAGAVIACAQRLSALETGDAEYSSASLSILDIESVRLDDIMYVNSDTICSLQIFLDESHPDVLESAANRRKEGLSLFGILNSTASPFGHQLMKSWFLRPLLSVEKINERLDAVSLLVRPDNYPHVIDGLKGCLKRVKNIPKIVANMAMGKATIAEWKGLLDFAYQCLKIRVILCNIVNAQDIKIVKKITEQFDSVPLREVCELITSTIDFDMSAVENRVVVTSGIDENLDCLKSQYDAIEELLRETAINLSRDLPDVYGDAVDAAYVPQIGFLVKIDLGADTGEPVYFGDDWELQFKTDQHAFFKSADVRELDENYGDLYTLICDIEIEIVHALQVDVLKYSDLLTTCCKLTAELDCLVSFAESATLYNYHRPTVTEDNVIDIKKGRHPLYELSVPSFVENDTLLRGSEGVEIDTKENADTLPSTILLTGANFSGKSVYLKQVALIVYMAHIGCFVPAASATIGLTDRILTRVMTRETVARERSAFMNDIMQICTALQLVTRRSLLIVDEFGKGTEACDGAGLFGALIEYVSRNACGGRGRPKVVAATHFHEALDENVIRISENEVKFVHMQVLINGDTKNESAGERQVDMNITYLYQLVDGHSTSSFGIRCAAMNGVPKEVIDRAEELSALLARGEDLSVVCSRLDAKELKIVEHAELVARRFLKENFSAGFDDIAVREKLRRVLGY
ncbi:mismatch repair protein 5 [Myxozyma melibiosi]|uniref:Mismatch repair protein 5 n=1 Tax=Myxozyma melibiosi TaxID=54550 RepID=A0ABR1F329_9ASCO